MMRDHPNWSTKPQIGDSIVSYFINNLILINATSHRKTRLRVKQIILQEMEKLLKFKNYKFRDFDRNLGPENNVDRHSIQHNTHFNQVISRYL